MSDMWLIFSTVVVELTLVLVEKATCAEGGSHD
jgi:hypothetical protein